MGQLHASECCTRGAGHRFPWPASRTVPGRRQKPIACPTRTQLIHLFHDKSLLGERSLSSHCSMGQGAAAPSERELRRKLQNSRIEGRSWRQESGSSRERTGGRVENVLCRQQRV